MSQHRTDQFHVRPSSSVGVRLHPLGSDPSVSILGTDPLLRPSFGITFVQAGRRSGTHGRDIPDHAALQHVQFTMDLQHEHGSLDSLYRVNSLDSLISLDRVNSLDTGRQSFFARYEVEFATRARQSGQSGQGEQSGQSEHTGQGEQSGQSRQSAQSALSPNNAIVTRPDLLKLARDTRNQEPKRPGALIADFSTFLNFFCARTKHFVRAQNILCAFCARTKCHVARL